MEWAHLYLWHEHHENDNDDDGTEPSAEYSLPLELGMKSLEGFKVASLESDTVVGNCGVACHSETVLVSKAKVFACR